MKSFLDHRSKRWGYDGWALRVRDAACPILWTVCTTREEARELRREARYYRCQALQTGHLTSKEDLSQ